MNFLTSSVRVRGLALTLLAAVVAPAFLATSAVSAAEKAAEKAALPLKASFKKDTTGKNEAPIILQLKNESSRALKVSARIDLSIVVHNRPKTRDVPAQTVAAGAALTIDNLAAEDKVTLTAEGHAPLVVVVPYVK